MQNPYAQANTTSASSAEPLSAQARLAADYETAIGDNSSYFLPKFEAFDSGESTAGWNWPAFFVTSPWFMYRKMWGPALLNLGYPFIIAFVLGIAFGVTKPPVAVMVGVSLLLLAAPSILLAIYANALYWRHIRKLITNLPRTLDQQPDKRVARLERNGGTGAGVMAAVLICLFFVVVMFTGILAAIAIPAYQDYTIRAQVTEGLNLAAGPKAAVAESWARTGSWPENSVAAGMEGSISGKYVESIDIEHGSVVITYGKTSNKLIADKRMALTPGTNARGEVIWKCGSATHGPGVTAAEGPSGSEIPQKYLPSRCREGGSDKP